VHARCLVPTSSWASEAQRRHCLAGSAYMSDMKTSCKACTCDCWQRWARRNHCCLTHSVYPHSRLTQRMWQTRSTVQYRRPLYKQQRLSAGSSLPRHKHATPTGPGKHSCNPPGPMGMACLCWWVLNLQPDSTLADRQTAPAAHGAAIGSTTQSFRVRETVLAKQGRSAAQGALWHTQGPNTKCTRHTHTNLRFPVKNNFAKQQQQPGNCGPDTQCSPQ